MEVKTTQNRKRNRAIPGPGGEHPPFMRDPYVNIHNPVNLLCWEQRAERPDHQGP